jgi:UDP-N-acetylglucosamine--N-acetylmuramyl-(pentapeptide) pyrophosphoryl-undecaprenol N-acetylglucosamine transferase
MRILVVAGGTGGHIFPALAVAEELRARASEQGRDIAIEFVGTHRPLEAKLIPAAGFRLRTVNSAGLKGMAGMQLLRNLAVLPRTGMEVAKILREFKPQAVLGVGGYLAGPVMLEAAMMRIPTVLIEANARPGFTNRVLGPVVRAAAVGFEDTAHLFGKKAHVTGLPVRKAFFEVPARPLHVIEPSGVGSQPIARFTVLVVGGSLGSKAINEAVSKGVPWRVPSEGAMASTNTNAGPADGIRIIHQTGERDYNEIRKTYQEKGLVAEVHAFIDDMPEMLAQADLVISRAGATTVAELAASGRPAVLIPFPGATDQHQLENARALEKAGAARVIVQTELTPARLAAEVQELLAHPAELESMAVQARRLARPDAAEQIAVLVEDLAGSDS